MSDGKLHYRAGYKYVVDATWIREARDFIGHAAQIRDRNGRILAQLDSDGFITVLPGYAWDGPSGPTIDTPSTLRASLAHDVLYQMMRERHLDASLRPEADDLLERMLVEDGCNRVRAKLWRWAVGRFSAKFAEPQPAKVLTAP